MLGFKEYITEGLSAQEKKRLQQKIDLWTNREKRRLSKGEVYEILDEIGYNGEITKSAIDRMTKKAAKDAGY